MHKLEETSTTLMIGLAIAGYSICSSTLLLANKVAILYLPSPTAISFVQVVSSTIIVLVIRYAGLEKVDDFEWPKVKAYLLYIVFFFSSIYANMKALAISNVETVIVFRACTPIAVCIIEHLFMDRELPSTRSSLSLITVALGAIIYCLSDSQLALEGISSYYWVILYFILITLEMTYGKTLTSNVKMDSVWGPVLYCNSLSILPFLLMGSYEGDFFSKLALIPSLGMNGLTVVIFSCIVGTLIGYSGWLCRGMLSATTFTLVGVVNKFLTVLLNVLIWDKHSTGIGLLAVSICLIAGVFYEQAPKRTTTSQTAEAISLKAEIAKALEETEELLGSDSA